jgi:hypothetical protein
MSGHDKDEQGEQENGRADSPIHVHKARMHPLKDAPPGLEQDGQGNVIPFAQRTKEDQEKAQESIKPGRKD